MRVGFTGSRHGLSPAQLRQLRYILAVFYHADQVVGNRPLFIDGDCPKGDTSADLQARKEALLLGYESMKFTPVNLGSAALLTRNVMIVAECDILIAAPETDQEKTRSGTWATVRYARKAGKPVVMLSRREP